MKNVIGRISTIAACLFITLLVSCDDNNKLEEFLDGEKPSVVTNLRADEVNTESLKLHWTAATDNNGVTAYEIYQGGVSIGTNEGETTYTVNGLTPMTNYEYYVVALDGAGNSSNPSESISITTAEVEDTEKPTAPANLESSMLTHSSVLLNWEASTDNVEVVDYEVFQNGTSIGLSQGATSMEISMLTPETAYEYYVVAKDIAGNVSSSSSVISITTLSDQDTELPTVPTDLKASQITTTSLMLNWTASTDNQGIKSYEVFMGEQSLGTTAETNWPISALEAETTYEFKVRAIDQSDNNSEFSQALTVTTSATAPTQTVAQIIESRQDLSNLYATISNFDFNLEDEEAGPFTVFAPNNAAFTSFGALPEGLALNILIAGHVVGGNYTLAELIDQGTVQSGTGSSLSISQDGSDVIINGTTKIIVKDIRATNGVVHVVDRIISN